MEVIERLQRNALYNRNGSVISSLRACLEHGTLPEGRDRDESGDPRLRLYPHQLQALRRMQEMEQGAATVVNEVSVRASMGVYCDSVGAGKSYALLALIARSAAVQSVPSRKRSHSLACGNVVLGSHTRDFAAIEGLCQSTLLVVPHSILRQWQGYLADHTPQLKVVVYKRPTNTRTGTVLEDVQGAHVVLCQSNWYNDFSDMIRESEVWMQRVIWDEADSAPIASASLVKARFYWLVTSSFVNLFLPGGTPCGNVSGYRHTGLIRDMLRFMDLTHFWPAYVVRSPDSVLRASFGLDEPEVFVVPCRAPRTTNLARQMGMTSSVVRALDAGDHVQALSHMGFDTAYARNAERSTDDLLCNAFLSTLTSQVEQRELDIQYLEGRERTRGTLSANERALLVRHRDELVTLRARMASLMSRVQSLATDVCLICHDLPESEDAVMITQCCQKRMCAACITSFIRFRNDMHPPCPNCRERLHGVVLPGAEAPEASAPVEETANLLSKQETILRLISEAPLASRFLLFSEFSTQHWQTALAAAGIRASAVAGHPTTIERTLEEFRNGRIQVLTLNAHNYGAGLNLQCTTDLIIGHSMPHQLVQQVIGRAQRPGRTSRLRVHKLVHVGEDASGEN